MAYQPDIVIYHYPCMDGLTAAATVYDYYVSDSKLIDIEFILGEYSKPAQVENMIAACRGKHVLLVDFTFPAQILQQVASSAQSVLVIDHHHTAQVALNDLATLMPNDTTINNIDTIEAFMKNSDKLVALFDMEESGASLTYKFFHPKEKVPPFVEQIKSIDLGGSRQPDEEFKWWSRGQPLAIPLFADYLHSNIDTVQEFREDGRIVAGFVENRLDQLASDYTRRGVISGVEFNWSITDYAFASDTANRYVEDGDRLGVAIYFTKQGLGASLRSSKDLDCSAIAKEFGGGGHKQAAGFNIAWSDVPDFVNGLLDEGIINFDPTDRKVEDNEEE